MIDLRPEEHAALARLQKAGRDGLTLLEVRLSFAIRLQLAGLAQIHSGVPQRVTITNKGAAFHRRDTFA